MPPENGRSNGSEPLPIETEYAGTIFRARLEARWAVFFDSLHIRWAYEPEGFVLSSQKYVPDFRLQLSSGPLWLEVKPVEAWLSGCDVDPRWWELGEATRTRTAVAFGIPHPEDLTRTGTPRTGAQMHLQWPLWELDHAFSICRCGAIGVEYEARSARICGERCWPGDDGQSNGDHPRIKNAYRRATAARFWPSTVWGGA